MQPMRDKDYPGRMRLAANGRRALPRLAMSRSQWATCITWAVCDLQPIGDEHYLGRMRMAANGRRALLDRMCLAANGRRALPGLDEERPEDPSILPVRRQISA